MQIKKKVNIYWNIIRIFFIFHFLFILCDKASEDMQQHQKLTKHECFHEWYHTADLWANHWEKLSDSWKYTQSIYELNLSLQNIFCTKKIWFNSSVQKIQKVQHADSAAAKEFN